ncbi:MAG: SURF1 family protein [Rhodobacteraceae bacterium]|nr:SURF1 family protein [Paracoccaceae bacterium]MBT7342998.1 SURF1 family protein [Paracoccaceae bacterium]
MRYWGMILLATVGTAILLGLGVWQVQRLAWKTDILAQIERKILAPAIDIPAEVTAASHDLLPVRGTGSYIGEETVRVLVSQKIYGAGYRLINAFELRDGRKIMVDRGFISVRAALPAVPKGTGQVTGNLQWPQEIDSFTPDNDLAANIWFARDVAKLSEHLQTEPILLVLRNSSFADDLARPLPKMSANIPNDHLNYALTWFSLALIWLGMSGYFLYRSRNSKT